MSTIHRHTVNETAFTLPAQPVFDYPSLMDTLKDYKRPRDKVTKLLRDKIIIRVKKGLYIRNNLDPSAIHVRELLANLIYGTERAKRS